MNEAGHDALHTLDLPRKNFTTDSEVIARARKDGRVVVSKDADFVQSFLITGEPALLLISTGNIIELYINHDRYLSATVIPAKAGIQTINEGSHAVGQHLEHGFVRYAEIV